MRKPIFGYNGYYEIDDEGNVYSLARTINRRDGTMATFTEKLRRPSICQSGYKLIRLCREQKYKTHSIHRLVARHFVPGYRPGLQVNHIDGNKLNNRFDNLEWVTARENVVHSRKINPNRKPINRLDEERVARIKRGILEGATQRELADKFNLSISTISYISAGYTWGHIQPAPTKF